MSDRRRCPARRGDHPLREGSRDQDRDHHAQPARPAQRADDRGPAALRRPDLHKASIDDDVKVLVIRGVGDHLGTRRRPRRVHGEAGRRRRRAGRGVRHRRGRRRHATRRRARYRARRHRCSTGTPTRRSGCRSLQDFKKISILEVKGYCYGWHFYQAADADLVISSDDALFGHPAFRYVGWGPRMWQWAHDDGHAQVPGDGVHRPAVHRRGDGRLQLREQRRAARQLEAEVAEVRAGLCAQPRRPTRSSCRRSFFEIMKQHQGEYMGSLLSGVSSRWAAAAPTRTARRPRH